MPVPLEACGYRKVVLQRLANEELQAFFATIGVNLFFGVASGEFCFLDGFEVTLLPGSIPGKHRRLLIVACHVCMFVSVEEKTILLW